MAKKATPVFVREATGLVKSVSLFDAVALNLSSQSTGVALATIGFTMALLPSISGVNLVWATLIGFALSIPQVIVYSVMTTRIPRTGGDYVWLSRSLNGVFASALTFMGFTLQTLAFVALTVLTTVFAIGSVGVSLGNMQFLGLALPGNIQGADTLSQFLIGMAIFALIIVVNVFKPKLGFKMVSVFTIIGIVTMLLAMGVIATAGKAGIEGQMDFLNSIGADATYASVKSSYTGPTFTWEANLFILPFFAIFVYPWITGGPAVASEIKGKNALKWNVPISATLSAALLAAGFAAMYAAGGQEFTNGALANPKLVYDFSFNFWTWAMGVSGTPVLAAVIGIGWIVWNIAVLGYAIIIFSRYVFAQAFDRFLPARLAYVSPRYGSPLVAHLFDLILTAVFVGAAAFLYGILSSLFGVVLSAVVYFAFVGLAIAIYGVRSQKGSLRGVLAVCGVLMSAVYSFLAYEFLGAPDVWGGNYLAYFYMAASFIAGLVIYVASKAYYGRQGIDIGLAFKEIPPE